MALLTVILGLDTSLYNIISKVRSRAPIHLFDPLPASFISVTIRSKKKQMERSLNGLILSILSYNLSALFHLEYFYPSFGIRN